MMSCLLARIMSILDWQSCFNLGSPQEKMTKLSPWTGMLLNKTAFGPGVNMYSGVTWMTNPLICGWFLIQTQVCSWNHHFSWLDLGAEVAKPSPRPRPGPGSRLKPLEALLCQRIWQPIFHQFTPVNFSQLQSTWKFSQFTEGYALTKFSPTFLGLERSQEWNPSGTPDIWRSAEGLELTWKSILEQPANFAACDLFLQDQEMPRQSKGLRTLSVPFWIFCEAIRISSPGFQICSGTRCNNIRFTTKTDIVTKWGRHGCNKS